jgi:hypothetical protein
LYRIEILAITGGFFKGSSPSGSVPARLYCKTGYVTLLLLRRKAPLGRV